MSELRFRPGGFRPGELTCADCRRAVDRLTITDWHGPHERFVCDDCHPTGEVLRHMGADALATIITPRG